MPRNTGSGASRQEGHLPTAGPGPLCHDDGPRGRQTLSAVVQAAMRAYRLARLRGEYRDLQNLLVLSVHARRGTLADAQLERYLKQKD